MASERILTQSIIHAVRVYMACLYQFDSVLIFNHCMKIERASV